MRIEYSWRQNQVYLGSPYLWTGSFEAPATVFVPGAYTLTVGRGQTLKVDAPGRTMVVEGSRKMKAKP